MCEKSTRAFNPRLSQICWKILQSMPLRGKKILCWAVSFPLPQCFLNQNDKLLLDFLCFVLRMNREKKMQSEQDIDVPWESFFFVLQVSVVLVVRWHFTKNPDFRLTFIWNETANPATTDENCNADCSYSSYIVHGNDITEYLKDLTSCKNCILLVL